MSKIDPRPDLEAGAFDRVAKMLALISQVGAAPLVPELLDSFVLQPTSEDFPELPAGLSPADRAYLAAPFFIGAAGSWEETLPADLRDRAMAERLEVVLGKLPGHIVGPSEFVAAAYATTMVAPVRSDFGDVYAWAACHSTARRDGRTFEEQREHLGMAGSYGIPTDAQILGNHILAHSYREYAGLLRRKLETLGTEARRRMNKRAAPRRAAA